MPLLQLHRTIFQILDSYVAGPPSYPEKFHYTERTKNSITLAWKPPRNDGGSPIIGYYVEKKKQDQQAFEPCNTEIYPDLSMTVEGLEDAWMYEFRIKCANLIGVSEPSIPMTVMIQDDEGKPEVSPASDSSLDLDIAI